MENENKAVESKKNSPIGFIIVLVVLFVLMIGCFIGFFLGRVGSYIVDSDRYNHDSVETVEDIEEPVVTNYEVTDERVSRLIQKIILGGMDSNCKAIERYAKDQKVEAKNLSSVIVYHVVEMNEFYNKKDSFSLDEMNTAIKKYFSDEVSFDPTSIDYRGASCPRYNYDSSTKMFTKQQTTCGSSCGPESTYKIVKAVDTDGVLKLDVKVIFHEQDIYYSDYERTNAIGQFSVDEEDTLLDKGSNYQFTFNLVDGNYVFVSCEPVK